MPRPKRWRSARDIRVKSSAGEIASAFARKFAKSSVALDRVQHQPPKLLLLVDDEPHRQHAGMRLDRGKCWIGREADVIFLRGDEQEVLRLGARQQRLRIRRRVAMMIGKA